MKSTPRHSGFTLAELLTGMGILVVMFSFLIMATNQMVRAMSSTTGKIEQFRDARDAFERVTTRLSQATLNAYWDYRFDSSTSLLPTSYERRSDLRFLVTQGTDAFMRTASTPEKGYGQCVFFNAPLGYTESAAQYGGLENLMNTWGFYVEYSQDTLYRPKFIGSEVPAKWRWRLMEFSQSTERFNTYAQTSGGLKKSPNADTQGTKWIFDDKPANFQAVVRPLVENVLCLILIPRLARSEEEANKGYDATNPWYSPLAPNYKYDTSVPNTKDASTNPRNQLPPVVQTTMVAIDAVSADRLSLDATTSDLFGFKPLKFTDTKNYLADMEGPNSTALEKQLVAKHINYRIFTTNVHVRGAKWSREQSDKAATP